ncbi:unnamed protein product [Pieris brassicae]|uniref:Integrase catalytic domain-containing protein n=2 Tax=Pieris brassicae TaxID=7116 RepID=A0A9P0U0S0_PIEBR|nr:unnamed protein product [Pieris brassicae]
MFQSSFDFSNKTTKRALLSDISKLFDPLGWLAPAITAMKIIFQEVWKQNIKWDDQIPTSILKKWKKFKEEIELSISKIRIPRWLQTSPDSTLELHGFCDASNKAYAAVIYCRINNKVSLVAAKTKLVPVKGKISIPRGELCGAVLLTKLFNKVKACLGYNKIKCYGWTDSMVTLGWIQGQPEKWKPFVSNRVKQIVQDMPSNTWRYVKSEENPADCASRGISVKQLEMHSLWWNGPSWLPLYRNDKETQSYFTKEEEKNQYLVNIVQGTDNTVKGIIQNCSSFSRAIRIVAWILRLLPRNKDKRERYLTLAEVKEAKRKIIRNVQEDDFFYEIEKLRRKESINKSTLIALNPYLGQDGLLRVGGRLRNAFISKDMQHPIIISHAGRLTDLIIDQAHKLTFHGGPRLTLSLIRQKYWIVGGNRAVKRQLRLCVTCVKNNPRMQYQIMGDLPEARCNPARPFKHTGVDFTGYILIKSSKGRGIKCTKGYIAVFICMATKAVHLEVVSDLTTSAFLAALKRMAARRGTPEHIYSDNGTNFIGANRVLDSGYDELKRVFAEEQFATTITDMEINWHFNAPAWPSAGGLWEAAVKSLKAHTKKVIGDQKFTYEEVSTLVAQLETCLNTRPLCPISEDPEDINFLTPAHFLTGGPTLSLLPTENDLRTRWYLVEKTFQDIWKRWQSEYLPTLTSRSKWQKPRENLKLQDLVAIHDANIPPGKWAMGRVVELHPGTDNIVRVVSLKTKNGVIKRPIVKLSPLPVQNSSKEAAENESNISAKPRPILRKGLGNVLAIMLSFIFFLTYVSATHPENYNISTFNNNKGLYLDKISNMQLIQEKWRIVVYYDMKPYWEGEKAFEQYYKTLQGMCSALDEKTHCEITMNQLRHSFEELKYYDQVLLTQHPGTRSKRRRRGLINGVGYAAHSLFGVLDESFAEQYQKDISLVKENEQHLANLWKNQTSVLEAEYNLMKRSEEENYNLRKLINRHANEVKKAITTQVTEINRLERITQFTLDSISATNVLANLRNMQEYLIDTITDIYHGRFNFHLISSEQLRRELNIISNHISTDLSLPINNSQKQFGNIYKFLRVKARMLYEQLILEISVPLVSRDDFEIYNVISVPYKSDALTMVKIVPISDLVAINKEKNSYIQMSENELLSSCDYYSDIYYCNLPKLFYNMKPEDSLCKTGMKKQCQVEKMPCDNEWIDLNKKNTYLYFCCDRCPLHIMCGDQISAEQLNTTGLISIGHGCMLRNKKGVIYAHNEYQNVLKTGPMVYSPYMDSINNMINVSLSSDVIENSKNNYTINSLDKIGTDLEDMRKEAPIISSVTFHDVHQYIALYSILGIFVVVGAILLLRRFRRAGTVAPVQQIPSGQATIPIQKTIDGQQETSIAALAAAVAASLAMGSTEPTRDRTPIGLSVSDSAVDWCRKC